MVRRFDNPVVIDIGEGNKTLRITVEQLGRDGSVLTRQMVAIAYGEDDDQVRPSLKQIEGFLRAPDR